MFLLDPRGQELVASVFDGAVQAQVQHTLTHTERFLTAHTVQGAKTIHFSFFHTLTYFSVMLQAILTSKVPK